MTTERERLLTRLAHLRTQLKETPSLDPSARTRLEETVADIEKSLEADEGKTRPDSSLVERLREAALNFEASHPTLAGAIGSVVDALAAIGI